jgi:predicted RNA-binding protein (virulence factor B family)
MIDIGKKTTLLVAKENKSGYYLQSESGDEVFLPGSVAPKDIEIGQSLPVFIYTDNSGGRLATTEMPLAQVDDFAYLTVTDVTDFGAFLNWGLKKDLLVPGNQQKERLHLGESHLVRICLEEETNRIYGTCKLGPYTETSDITLEVDEEVDLLPFGKTPLGYKVLINQNYMGMIYHNEIFTKITLGESIKGLVKNIRPDGLIDAALQAQGMKNLKNGTKAILEALEKYNGSIPLTDKSDPRDIKYILGMSKQAFKKSVGILYRDRKIVLNQASIDLPQ